MPDIQPPGTDRQLADAIDSNGGHAARYEKSPENRDKTPAAESPVREDNKPGLAADSGYGPSLWAEELDTPKQRLSCDEMPDRPCGRRGGTVVRYNGAQRGAGNRNTSDGLSRRPESRLSEGGGMPDIEVEGEVAVLVKEGARDGEKNRGHARQ